MTGFGRGESGGWAAEIRSVNHRFCEIQHRLPRSLASLEGRFRDELKKRIKRGRVEVACYPDGRSVNETRSMVLDEQMADQLLRALIQLKERYGIAQEVELSHILSQRDIFRTVEESPDLDQVWQAILPALMEALEAHDQMRLAEGGALLAAIRESLQNLQGLREQIAVRAPDVTENYRDRLAKRLEGLLPGQEWDEGRLLQEAAVFADRSDITEELSRLSSHIDQFRSLPESTGPHGRQLEFLLQEMNREVNTIGSKANDLSISQWVVASKAELEKMREQIQNVE